MTKSERMPKHEINIKIRLWLSLFTESFPPDACENQLQLVGLLPEDARLGCFCSSPKCLFDRVNRFCRVGSLVIRDSSFFRHSSFVFRHSLVIVSSRFNNTRATVVHASVRFKSALPSTVVIC